MIFGKHCLGNICVGGRHRARTCDFLLEKEGQGKTLWPVSHMGFSTMSPYLQDLVTFH